MHTHEVTVPSGTFRSLIREAVAQSLPPASLPPQQQKPTPTYDTSAAVDGEEEPPEQQQAVGDGRVASTLVNPPPASFVRPLTPPRSGP